jgi:tRNA pseudouridine13 synthase
MAGTQSKYPSNETTDFIYNLIKQDNISIDDLVQNKMAIRSKGVYRKIIERPKEVKHAIVYHDDNEQDLQNEYYNIEPHPEPKGTKYKSLRLQFQLSQSTYATMLFRELTKQSSTVNYQAGLSKNIKTKI